MSDQNYRTTQNPQKLDSARADAEWKADSGLDILTHGVEGKSNVDRSSKAVDIPEGDFQDHVASGGGSRGVGGQTGDGKGPINPDESVPKKKREIVN